MTIVINKQYVLTTEHPASSYGQPVLVRDGIAYGAGDVIDDGIFGLLPAADVVRNFAQTEQLKAAMTHSAAGLSAAEHQFVHSFLAQGGKK